MHLWHEFGYGIDVTLKTFYVLKTTTMKTRTMKTRTMTLATLLAVLLAGVQALSARPADSGQELERIVRAIGYPTFGEDWNITGTVRIAALANEAGEIEELKVWGSKPHLSAYVESELRRQLRGAVADAGSLNRYRLVFETGRREVPAFAQTTPVVSPPIESVLRSELAALGGSARPGSVNVVIRTNSEGLVEDVSVWGRDTYLVSELTSRLGRLGGRAVVVAGQETTFRYKLVKK